MHEHLTTKTRTYAGVKHQAQNLLAKRAATWLYWKWLRSVTYTSHTTCCEVYVRILTFVNMPCLDHLVNAHYVSNKLPLEIMKAINE